MTQAAEILAPRASGDFRVVGAVSAAHFVSHFYLMLLPPLFSFVRADYDVSYTELGFALTAFNVVSAALQTPTGFMVDRFGPRILLVGGLTLGAASVAAAGLIDSFWVFVAAFAAAGLANTVYHPADYALLSQQVSPDRLGRAFSIHTFAGILGSAVAPATLLLIQNLWGWRGALIGAAGLGFATAGLLLAYREGPPIAPATGKPKAVQGARGWPLLLSTPILLNLMFFVLLALNSGGLQYYSVVALTALHGTAPVTANTALSGYLLLSAIGVLAGGAIAARFTRHGLTTSIGLLVLAILALILASFDLGAVALIIAMSVGGLFNGIIMPARDLIVREMTPAGSFGKVFGFVSTGFNLGGIVAPLIFGAVLDSGSPRLVFIMVAGFSLVSILTVAFGRARLR